jgi:hypothetical protein
VSLLVAESTRSSGLVDVRVISALIFDGKDNLSSIGDSILIRKGETSVEILLADSGEAVSFDTYPDSSFAGDCSELLLLVSALSIPMLRVSLLDGSCRRDPLFADGDASPRSDPRLRRAALSVDRDSSPPMIEFRRRILLSLGDFAPPNSECLRDGEGLSEYGGSTSRRGDDDGVVGAVLVPEMPLQGELAGKDEDELFSVIERREGEVTGVAGSSTWPSSTGVRVCSFPNVAGPGGADSSSNGVRGGKTAAVPGDDPNSEGT